MSLNIKRYRYLRLVLGLSQVVLCFVLHSYQSTCFSYAQKQSFTHLQALGDCEQDSVNTPLWPHDFTYAFQQSQAWVVSIAAGETYQVTSEDQKQKTRFKPLSEGSGIIWGDSRLVITNAHVVQHHKKIRARTYQRQVLKLDLVGVYPELDIAVLKTSTPKALSNLPSACYTLNLPPIGSWVASVGHPYSMPYSLSTGVVSAHHRGENLQEWSRAFPGFIQSNLTLNPGNSGGPLINEYGMMVGMNTAIRQHAVGMSFSLPLSRLIPVINQIVEYGSFKRSYIGIKLSEVSFLKSQKANFKEPRGVRVKQVTPNSPAAQAGLQKNDIILEVNGKKFNDPSSLSWEFISSLPHIPMMIKGVRYSHDPKFFVTTLFPTDQKPQKYLIK